MRTLQRIAWGLVMLVAISIATTAQSQVRLYLPADLAPPIYSNLALGFTPNDGEWAVVFFYRSPECIPPGFNLLDFIDTSGAAFSCPLHIEGATIWRSLDDPYPASSLLHGTDGVPVWFVRWSEMQSLVADDVLTIGELATAASLITGTASQFLQSARNDIRGERGGNESDNALGEFDDGRTFQVQFTEKFRDGVHTFPSFRIEFR